MRPDDLGTAQEVGPLLAPEEHQSRVKIPDSPRVPASEGLSSPVPDRDNQRRNTGLCKEGGERENSERGPPFPCNAARRWLQFFRPPQQAEGNCKRSRQLDRNVEAPGVGGNQGRGEKDNGGADETQARANADKQRQRGNHRLPTRPERRGRERSQGQGRQYGGDGHRNHGGPFLRRSVPSPKSSTTFQPEGARTASWSRARSATIHSWLSASASRINGASVNCAR